MLAVKDIVTGSCGILGGVEGDELSDAEVAKLDPTEELGRDGEPGERAPWQPVRWQQRVLPSVHIDLGGEGKGESKGDSKTAAAAAALVSVSLRTRLLRLVHSLVDMHERANDPLSGADGKSAPAVVLSPRALCQLITLTEWLLMVSEPASQPASCPASCLRSPLCRPLCPLCPLCPFTPRLTAATSSR